MHRRSIALAFVSMICGLACSANTLGTAMEAGAEQDSLGDEPGSTGGGESGSAGVDESDSQGTTTTTTTTTTTASTTTDDGSCPVGSEGCPCTGGGGCDAGLECDAGMCVPSSSTSESTTDPTTGSTTDSTTTDSTTTDSTTTTGGDPFMCDIDNNCWNADPVACSCVGCNTNGYCSNSDDCVCPDCANENFCAGNACTNDGLCDPYTEGCSCSDCAMHPLCG